MTGPFDVCWDRIRRANTHSEAIATAWSAFIKEEPYNARVEVDDDGNGYISIEQSLPIPPVITFEFGEFLYQLRAALDAATYECACANQGTRPPTDEHKLEFPICGSPKKFDESCWKIAPLTDQQRAIIKAIQPYNTPTNLPPKELPYSFNRAIGILNDWARKDRHRKLHVIATQASNVQPLVIVPSGVRIIRFAAVRNAFIFENQHCEVAAFQVSGWQRGMEVSANPNLMLDIGVDEIPDPCHEVDTLALRVKAMVRVVAAVVNGLAETVGIRTPEDFLHVGAIRSEPQPRPGPIS
jgi:hypothetical protein